MKRGAYLVNTARGKICDRDAIVRALESGQLAGYAGDVWFPQPALRDHPWRAMPHHGMTPHISGSAQTQNFLPRAWEIFLTNLARYRAGSINHWEDRPTSRVRQAQRYALNRWVPDRSLCERPSGMTDMGE